MTLLEVVVAMAIIGMSAAAGLAAAAADLRSARTAMAVVEVNALAELTATRALLGTLSTDRVGYTSFEAPFSDYDYSIATLERCARGHATPGKRARPARTA